LTTGSFVTEASGVVLKSTSRIAVVNRSNDLRWVWARNTQGEILAMDYNSNPGSGWINFGKPNGVSVNINGVAGTSWDTGAGWSQHVFFVGSDGNFYEGVKVGAGPVTWTGYPFVSGQTLTGHLAAGQVVADPFGTRMIAVVGTTTSGLLYRFTRNIGGSSASWVNSSGGRTWATDLPLASSVHPSQLGSLSFYGSMIVSGTNTELGMVHFDSFGEWNVGARGSPGFPVCGSIAAAEAWITPSTFRRYVICTRADANSATIAYAYGTSDGDTTFDWITETLPATVSTTRGNIVGATAQDVGGGNTSIDHYVIATNNHLYRQTRNANGLASPVDLGQIAEADWGYGGMSATDTIYNYSRVFYLGRLDSAVGSDAIYLYERTSSSATGTEQYQNYGAGDSLRPVVSGGAYAEGMIAEYAGTATVALIERPGNGGPNGTNFPRVHAFRSDNDTHTMLAGELLANVVGGRTYNYVVDPTVAVTRARRSYILQLGVERSTCYGTNAATGAAVYLKRIDEGGSAYTTIPMFDVQLDVPRTSTPIDHPFLSIEHGGFLTPDRLHMAWWNLFDEQDSRIIYTYLDDGDTTAGVPHNLTGSSGVVGPPRVVANSLGDVYVYTSKETAIKVCKLNSSLNACDGGWQTAVNDFAPTDTKVNAGGTLKEMRTITGYSLAASPSVSGVVHLCYQKEEAASSTLCPGRKCKDIWCTRGAFSGGTFNWSAAAAVSLQNDEHDQFMPEVSMTAKSFTYQTSIASEGEVYVFWYDRRADSQNHLYRVRVSRSLNGGTTWASSRELTGDADPLNLPLHCLNGSGNLYFIGDYSASRASLLHTHGLFVTTPGGLRTTDATAAFRSLGSWWD